MKIIQLALIGTCLAARSAPGSEPLLNSWFTLDSDKFARIYLSDGDKYNDVSATTWSNGRQGQSQPAYSGVQEILASRDSVYIRSTGLPTHVMGPWYLDPQHFRPFPNLPTDQRFTLRLPRHPTLQSGRDFNHLGEIGVFVDGVLMFDANDSFSYSNQNRRDADPRAGLGHGDKVWNRDAFVNEGITFDAALAHQQNWGTYHYHVEPIALRYLLGDHVDFDESTKTYRESAARPVKHSPILGWMWDGFPVYGPYGYSSPSNSASGVRRMVSGFVARNGANGANNLALAGRRFLPAWAARERNCTQELAANYTGPNVTALYPIGHYIEDYAFLGDLGKAPGRDFDLDEFNGRWCVTPEFPMGTYAYFTAISADGKPVYPYNMGRRYRGVPSGGRMEEIGEPVTTTFAARKSAAQKTATPARNVTLVWKPDANGGSYQPESK